ncbi:MAG: hypothetical protein NVS4B6_23670 [Mycobacterium sp.]
MQVTLSSHDGQTAQSVRVALEPLCRELSKRTEQDLCRLMLAPGVLVAEFYAKDGERAQVPVGVTPLAAALASGPATVKRYADQMIRWAKAKQARSRIQATTGLILN